MSRVRRRAAGLVAVTLVLSATPSPARADNCGSLNDCYGTVAAAVAVVVAIALLVAVIAFLPEVLAVIGVGVEAAETLTAAEVVTAATEAGFSVEEAGIVAEASQILQGAEMAEIAAAHEAGESVVVQVGGRLIQYEPGLPASGMTMFGENGFLIGNEAFASEGELAKTVLHELYRLGTSSIPGAGVDAATAASETQAAAGFAERAFTFLKGLIGS